MKQISIPAMLRVRVPDDTPLPVIEDIIQALQSDTIPTIEGCNEVVDMIVEQIREYALHSETSESASSIMRDNVDVWVDGSDVKIHEVEKMVVFT